MLDSSRYCVTASLLIGLLSSAGFAADGTDETAGEEKKLPFSVKFIDQDGQPVEGVKTGVTAFYSKDKDMLPVIDGTGWQYENGATSNAEGVAKFPDGRDEEYSCVVARHPTRKLVAVWKIQPKKLDPEKTSETVSITVHPECRISGHLTSSDFIKRNLRITGANLYLNAPESRAFFYQSPDMKFHFLVPPGDYVIEAYSGDFHIVERKLAVRPGQLEVNIETIDLPAKQFALLQGLPAPPIDGIETWKNGPAIELSKLKGKCVILDFWGYWCQPCVYGMPELFKLYDKHRDEGLEIIGIHVDLGEDEEHPIDTVEKLDGRLTKIRQDVWKGRDIPYPVGLVSGKRIPFGTGIESRKARSEISAAYGIDSYPTLILIDRRGNIVQRFSPRDPDHIALLEKLLNEK